MDELQVLSARQFGNVLRYANRLQIRTSWDSVGTDRAYIKWYGIRGEIYRIRTIHDVREILGKNGIDYVMSNDQL